jgi:hypothetical protein
MAATASPQTRSSYPAINTLAPSAQPTRVHQWQLFSSRISCGRRETHSGAVRAQSQVVGGRRCVARCAGAINLKIGCKWV